MAVTIDSRPMTSCNAREDNPHWSGDDVGYSGVHHRLRAWRGNAKTHDCARCGQPASQWALNKSVTDKMDSQGRRYNLDPDRYEPLCIPCHKDMDGGCFTAGGSHPNSKLSDDERAILAELRAAGTPGSVLANMFGIRRDTVFKIAAKERGNR